MKVELIAHTPEPEKVVAASAKLCYSPVGVEDLLDRLDEESTRSFLEKLVSLGHASPLEHVSFTFAVEGVSRVLTHQLVRHRIASYSQQSQRYVKLEQFEYITPPNIAKNVNAKAVFEQAMAEDQAHYNKLTEILEADYFETFIKAGKSDKVAKRDAEKKAIEDARFVFPNACETKIVLTMNARSLFNFFEHRCCNRAQWEIRDMANLMLRELVKVAPVLFSYTGPKCVHGACPEGVMTCGNAKDVRTYYKTLLEV